jgi:hypothetical protein
MRLCCPRSRKNNASSITPRAAYSEPCSGSRGNVSVGLGGVFRLHRGDDMIQYIGCHRPSASHAAPAPCRRGHLASHSRLVQGVDGGAASTAVTRRVRTPLWQGRAGRCSAVYCARSADLSPFALSAPLRWTPITRPSNGLPGEHNRTLSHGCATDLMGQSALGQ